MNNADSAADYISRLKNSLQADIAGLVATRSQHEKEKVDNCLAGFHSASTKLKTILEQVCLTNL